MTMTRALMAAGMLATVLAMATRASADGTDDGATPHMTVVYENGHRIYRFDHTPIHGERQAPYAFAVTGRGPLGYSSTEPTQSFTAAVVSAVRRAPF